MATVQELERAFLNAHTAGDKQAAKALADALKSAMAAQTMPAAPKAEPETGFMAGMKAGYERLKGDIGAIAATANMEGAEEYAAKQREKAGEIYRQPEFTEKPVDYVTGLLGGSVPYLVGPLVAAAAAPEALGALGAAGLAGLASATQFTGSNISRQLEEGVSAKNANVVNAMAASVPQAALDVIGFKFMPAISKMFSKAGAPLTEEAATSILGKYILPAAKTAGVEGATEAGQQVLERAQAGLSITDPEARKEYFDSFVGGAILGGAISVPGGMVERARAAQAPEQPPEAEAPRRERVETLSPAAPPTPPAVETLPPEIPAKTAAEQKAELPAEQVDTLRARAEAVPEGEYMSREPVEREDITTMRVDEEQLEKERRDLEKRIPGKSLWSAVEGKLTTSDISELGGKKYQFLQAGKNKRARSISELAADGDLNDWLPPNLQIFKGQQELIGPDEELTRAKNADEYIKDKLREGNYLTYETNRRLSEIGTSLRDIERSYQEINDEEYANSLAQEAVNEQRRIDQEAATAPAEREAGGLEPPARVYETIPEATVEEEYYPDMNEGKVEPPTTEQEVKEDEIEKQQEKAAVVPAGLGELVMLHQFGKAIGAEPKYKRTTGGVSANLEFAPNKELSNAVQNNDPAGVISQLQQSSNPFIKRVADLAAQANPFGVGLFPENASRKAKKYAGIYNPNEKNVYLRSKATAASEHVVSHEIVHHLTLDALRNPTDAQKPIIKKIDYLYQHVKSVLTKQGHAKLYALKNVEEFVAEAESNVNFQYQLSRIPFQKQTAWSAFTNYISQLLGFKESNALTEIIALTDELAKLPSQQTVYGKKEVVGIEGKETTAQKAKAAAQKALQKRKLPKSQFEGVDDDYYQQLEPIFAPERKTIIDKIDGMRDDFWTKLAQGVADQYRSIKDISEEAYMKARMSKTIDGALEGILFNGEVKLTDGALDIAKDTKGLLKVLEPVGAEVDRYQIWVALNRDAQLVAQGKAPSVSKDIVRRRNELAEGKIGNKSRLEVYRQVQQDMNKLNRSVLKVAFKQGIIDKEAYKVYARDINYIPFYKMMDENGDVQAAATKSGLVNQYFSKALKGGEKPFGDLMENTLRNWSHILSSSMKNEAANATIRATMDMGGAYPNLKVGLDWQDGKVYSAKTGQLVGDGKLKPEYTTSGKGTVKTMIDGKPAYFDIKEPLLLESIMSIGYMGPKSKFLDIARDFKNMLQFGVTLSPAFKIRNLFRDSISAMSVTDLKKNPFANVIEGWAASNKNNPAHISALAGGAIFNFGSVYEGDQAKLIKRLLDKGVKGDNILDNEKKIKAGLGKAWRAYQELGNKSESANRMALYNQLKEQGLSHLEASFYARDMLDFSMQGAWPAFRLVTQVVPFLNARVQGLYKLGRDGIIPTSRVIYNTATGKPIEDTDKQRAQQFGVVMGAVTLASILLYLAFKDDDEFKKREQWDRDNFWWFKLPGMDSAIRVPKPFEIGAIGTMAERVVEQISDKGVEGKVFEQSFKRMLTDTFAINPIPQMIKPIVDLYANKDSFTGAPIETAGMERLSKAERIAERTSPLAIGLSKTSNVFLPESMETSPVQADYAIKAYLGWLGGTISATSHYAVQPFSKSAYPDNNWTETMSMGFIKSLPATQSKYVTAFYENNKEISQAYADMRHFAQLGQADKVQEILKEKGDKIAMAKFYDNASKDMAKMRQSIQAIRNDENMTGAQKKEEIDRMKVLIGEIARQMEEARIEVKKTYAAAR